MLAHVGHPFFDGCWEFPEFVMALKIDCLQQQSHNRAPSTVQGEKPVLRLCPTLDYLRLASDKTHMIFWISVFKVKNELRKMVGVSFTCCFNRPYSG